VKSQIISSFLPFVFSLSFLFTGRNLPMSNSGHLLVFPHFSLRLLFSPDFQEITLSKPNQHPGRGYAVRSCIKVSSPLLLEPGWDTSLFYLAAPPHAPPPPHPPLAPGPFSSKFPGTPSGPSFAIVFPISSSSQSPEVFFLFSFLVQMSSPPPFFCKSVIPG